MENPNTTPNMNPQSPGKGRLLGTILLIIAVIAVAAWLFTRNAPPSQESALEELSTSTRMAILEESKEEMIEGILRTREVLLTNDPKVIRDYILESATKGEKEELKKLSDQDLLNGISLWLPAYELATREVLEATTTLWAVIDRDYVRVGIPASGDEYVLINTNKVGRKWY